MVLLQPRLNVKLSQKQILTPGLVQMVSVLALNKIELKDMINAEMMENPVLEELDATVPLLDEVAGKEEDRERAAAAANGGGEEAPLAPEAPKSDPFDEIDQNMDSYFNEYLDPGYRSPEMEFAEKPSFENFLSKPTTLTEHLMWQLGAISLKPPVRDAAELVIGNLNEDGYLTASDEELMNAAAGLAMAEPPDVLTEEEVEAARKQARADAHAAAHADASAELEAEDRADYNAGGSELAASVNMSPVGLSAELPDDMLIHDGIDLAAMAAPSANAAPVSEEAEPTEAREAAHEPSPEPSSEASGNGHAAAHVLQMPSRPPFTLDELHEGIAIVRQMDPVGVAARDLRECLLSQLQHLQTAYDEGHEVSPSLNGDTEDVLADAVRIVSDHLKDVQNKHHKEIARALGCEVEQVMTTMEFIKTLDPKPGLRYNKVDARLIEPDVALVKHGDEYLVVLNDEDVPQLRLNPTYKRLLNRQAADKDVRGYVKERYKSAIQLIKNIEQRKQTILKVCYAIVGRQRDFLDRGIDQLKPMMIKEVAEEIGVHPSTVSRAVANKYAHTPQGVFELRYFFSEGVNGPEGSGTSLLILKRRVKKLIEEEDPTRPLTDEQITRILQAQGIQVTRRTVAKYREDMKIPSTHQRRVKT